MTRTKAKTGILIGAGLALAALAVFAPGAGKTNSSHSIAGLETGSAVETLIVARGTGASHAWPQTRAEENGDIVFAPAELAAKNGYHLLYHVVFAQREPLDISLLIGKEGLAAAATGLQKNETLSLSQNDKVLTPPTPADWAGRIEVDNDVKISAADRLCVHVDQARYCHTVFAGGAS